MSTPELDPNNLTDHERQMIAVAEGGDPNDPSEVPAGDKPTEEGDKPDFELPEGFESFDELVEAAKRGKGNDDETVEESETEEAAEGEAEDAEPDTLSGDALELREMKVYEKVGGRERYAEMTEFAKANLTPEQVAIYDAAVQGTDPNIAMFAVEGLKAMHQLHSMNTHGQEGEMTHPSGGLQAVQGYATYSDMMADMADPRYETDPTFNAQVVQKMALSSF